MFKSCRVRQEGLRTFVGVRLILASVAWMGLWRSVASAQCLQWSTAFPNGPSEEVAAFRMFNDGSGPALYVGGWFASIVNGPPVNHVAKWSGTSWSALTGGGTNGVVTTLEVYNSGTGPVLVAGGGFTTAGGVQAYLIAKWNGSSWSSLGGGIPCLDAAVNSLAAYGSSLYVGGRFCGPAGVPSKNVVKWNGTIWQNMAGGVGVGDTYVNVLALAIFDDGNGPALYAGGGFSNAGGVPVRNIAKWDGTSWSPLGTPPNDGMEGGISSMVVFDDGTGPALYVAAVFSVSPATFGVAKWNGSNWSSVGGEMNSSVNDLAVFDDGGGPALYAVGHFTVAGGVVVNRIARWDGMTWSPLGSGLGGPGGLNEVFALGSLYLPTGERELFAGGRFSVAGATASQRIAAWRACSSDVETFCFGDGTVAACPCSNQGAYGHGCENSQANGGARLSATGAPSPDTIVLHASGELPTALSIFLQGDSLVSASVGFGDGLRCAGGNLKRLFVKSAVSGQVDAPGAGDPSISAQSANLGDPIPPGSTRYYQTYYRDPDPSFCPDPSGSTFNATNGVRVVW